MAKLKSLSHKQLIYTFQYFQHDSSRFPVFQGFPVVVDTMSK